MDPRGTAVRVATLLGVLALTACESPTGVVDEQAVVVTSARRYVATATPLPAAAGFLTRYDFDVSVHVLNRSRTPMPLDRCDGRLVAIVAGGGPTLLEASGAQFIVEAERGLCEDVDQVVLRPGESLTHHARFYGLSSQPAFVSGMDKSYQVIVSIRGRPLWSAPFTIHLPPAVEY